MLKTFDENLVITAVQQLTTDLDSLSGRIKKLEEGGGGGDWGFRLIHEEDLEVSTTSTSQENVKDIYLEDLIFTKDEIPIILIKDKAGPRAGYFYGYITMIMGAAVYAMNEQTTMTSLTNMTTTGLYVKADGTYAIANNFVGLFPSTVRLNASQPSDQYVRISSKYNANNGAIDGTFTVIIGAIKTPANWIW